MGGVDVARALLDLRSDTASQVSREMLEALQQTAFGDDLLREDESTNALIQEACSLFGMEDAVLTPSGTMSNQIAVIVSASPGSEVLLGPESHVFNLESGGLSANAGVQARSVPVVEGVYSADAIEQAIRVRSLQEAGTGLICLEATYDLNKGFATPIDNFAAVRQVSERSGVPVFLDGARVLNLAVATGVHPSEICMYVDSVQICLNKGLGAPQGSLLMGSADFIRGARFVRQRLGGGMRHTGMFAAPGRIALRDWESTLSQDHDNATELAAMLESIDGVRVVNSPVPTNILNVAVLDSDGRGDGFVERLRRGGVLAKLIGPASVRLVTHRTIKQSDLERVAHAISAAV